MNSITLKRKPSYSEKFGIPWEFKYENGVYGPGYYYLSTYKTGQHVLYRMEFNWHFEASKGHVPDIRIVKLGEDKRTWLEATKACMAHSVNFGHGCYTFK